MKSFRTLAILALSRNALINAFAPNESRRGTVIQRGQSRADSSLFAEGFGSTAVKERTTKNNNIQTRDHSSIENMSAAEAKKHLIDLIPRMTGKDEEYRTVEAYVNLLEDKYSPVQTIDFLNLAMSGDWQLLFSTNLTGSVNRKLRLRELVQRIESKGFNGSLTNIAQWDHAEDGEVFDAYGTFSVKCSYKINQGARMIVDLNDHELRPSKGSKIPEDVPGLVALLHRAIPKEMFDPNGHAMDTTYLDADLRIVRLTGPHHEGCRNIFMRQGSLVVNPASSD